MSHNKEFFKKKKKYLDGVFFNDYVIQLDWPISNAVPDTFGKFPKPPTWNDYLLKPVMKKLLQ